jgi:hypothetical protein
MTAAAVLPPSFAALEPYAAWGLATETERNRRRLSSTFQEISAFAEAILPQVEAISAYIDARAADGALSDETKRLYYLLLSLAEVAPAIESYHPQAAVIDGYDSARFAPDETHRLRPKL